MKKDFASAIKEIRIKNKLTQKQFAEKFYITEKAISNYENGLRLPDLQLITKICETFNISMDYFMEAQDKASNPSDLIISKKNGKCAIYDKEQSIYLTEHIYDGIIISSCGNHIVYKAKDLIADSGVRISGRGEIFYSAVVNNFGEVKEFPNLVLGYNGGFNNNICPALNKTTNFVHLVDGNGDILTEGFQRIKPVDTECNLGLYYGINYGNNQDIQKRVLLYQNGEQINLKFDDINAPWGECKLFELSNLDKAVLNLKMYGANLIKLLPDNVFEIAENYAKIISAVNEHSIKTYGTSAEVLYACRELTKKLDTCKPQEPSEEVSYPNNIVGNNKIEENYIRKQINILYNKLTAGILYL